MKLVPAAETAFALRRALGPVQCWEDLLADFRRGKRTDLLGSRLLPYGVIGPITPLYHPREINVFIDGVRRAMGTVSAEGLSTIDVEPVPPAHIALPWKLRSLKRRCPGLASGAGRGGRPRST